MQVEVNKLPNSFSTWKSLYTYLVNTGHADAIKSGGQLQGRFIVDNDIKAYAIDSDYIKARVFDEISDAFIDIDEYDNLIYALHTVFFSSPSFPSLYSKIKKWTKDLHNT